MKDADLHLSAGIGTLVATAAMVVMGLKSGDCNARAASKPEADPFANMKVIDAALAEVSKEPDKQPQKTFKPPPPPEKPVGVKTDPTKPSEKPEEPPPKPPPPKDVDLSKYMRPNNDEDDDAPVGTPTKIERGVIGGSEVGFGDKTFGDPYLGALKSTFLRLWEYPEILDDVGTPIGCIRLEPDGSIKQVKLAQPSGNADLDTSVEKALADFMKKVNQDPKAVPDNLKDLTRIPLCWRMKV